MNKILTLIVALFVGSIVFGQAFDNGFPYQMQLTSQNGGFINSSPIQIRINIRSGSLSGNLHWQEEHQLTTNDFGHVEFIVGEGTNTGNGSNALFTDIPWETGVYFLEVMLDENNTGSFISLINSQIMAVPFAFHSKTTDQEYSLSELINVDTTGIQVGDVLQWDGSQWVPDEDNVANSPNGSDTVLYANMGDNAIYADTAFYSDNCFIIQPADSALYSYYADTSLFAINSNFAFHADSAEFADTSTYALYAANSWRLDGNTIGTSSAFLGTVDSTDLIFKTNNVEHMRIKANGKIGIGTNTPLADVHMKNNDGVVFTGTFGQGNIPVQGGGSRMMWYPGKAAFRAGTVSSNIWDDSQIGDYSFASGYNTRVSGDYSAAFGFQSAATGDYAFAAGHACVSSGDYSFSVGESSLARGPYSMALGRAAQTGNGDTAAVAIGYHPTANAKFSMAFGNYTVANQPNSFAFGFKAVANHSGSFVYADQSTQNVTTPSTAANQFMVKASGGSIFYTDANLTTGVTLPAGGGAWSSLSDKNVKENIQPVDKNFYLEQLDSIEISKWNYITQDDDIKHIGPMAQDFYKYFNIGTDPTRINSLDFDGINLLLLQAIYEKTVDYENQHNRLNELEKELKKLREERKELESMVDQLEKKYAGSSKD